MVARSRWRQADKSRLDCRLRILFEERPAHLEAFTSGGCIFEREGFVKRGFHVSVEVVHDQHDFPGIWQKGVRQMVETVGEIQRRAVSVTAHEDITFSQMRHGDHINLKLEPDTL